MWPNAGLAVAVVLVGILAGVGISGFARQQSGGATAAQTERAASCGDDTEPLHVAADEAVVDIVRDLADRYTMDLLADGRDCVPIEVQAVTASAVVGRLTNGWRSQTHGPRPEVWIPKSTLWVELLRAQLDDPSIIPEDPTVLARSPTVMAMPRPMAEQLGWPDERSSWSDLWTLADADDGWARRDRSEWGPFRLELTDPRYTTTGLQALLALDAARRGQEAGGAVSTLSLFRTQRALAEIDASSAETLERYLAADDPLQALSAMPLEERELWRFNATGSPEPSTAASDPAAAQRTATDDRADLVAVYPEGSEDIAMEADYPYVLLDTPWVSREILQFADEFGDYLLSDTGVDMFTAAGFRTRDNEPGEVLRGDDALEAMGAVGEQPPGDLPEVDAFRRLRSAWVTVPRVSKTLFIVDVSGSMEVIVPDSDQTRLQATVEAAKRALEILPGASDVGLWEFSTDLRGGEHRGDYRELVSVAPLNRIGRDGSHKDELVAALDGIDAENDTALNDTLLAAYEQLRADYTPGRRNLIVLLTDGRNDDDDSITHEELMQGLQRLHRPEQPIQVVSIAYGEQPDLDKMAEISETVGGRVIESPELRNLDRLFIEALAR